MNCRGKNTKPSVCMARGRRGPSGSAAPTGTGGSASVGALAAKAGTEPRADQAPPAARAREHRDRKRDGIEVGHALGYQPVTQHETVDGGPAQLAAAEASDERELDEDHVSVRRPAMDHGVQVRNQPQEPLERL